jgi:hypothetical protein
MSALARPVAPAAGDSLVLASTTDVAEEAPEGSLLLPRLFEHQRQVNAASAAAAILVERLVESVE